MKTPPDGMKIVTKDEFWRRVVAERRDIHPHHERDYTLWQFNQTRRLWGWCSEGFASPDAAAVYAIAEERPA